VVAEHRDYGESCGRQELAGDLGFEQATVLSKVASDKQEIGGIREAGKVRDGAQVLSATEVEVSDGRHANSEELRGADLRNERWQLIFHGTEAYLIGNHRSRTVYCAREIMGVS
jgi:hypothetical protein